MSEENHDALESDSAIESPMKIPKKTHSRLSVTSKKMVLIRENSFLSIGQVNFL